ncbi:hypothetical protein [Flavobacterium sp. SLB02]|uniref:hypothetical protein n=1 Tax=Flavobacterium sp. SLB02 TaxID=2665645 RepID=UPI0012A98A65|nr:hypothetical protein [Flavobacterium sp. SLB02]QGK75260.1 hypothetical protein GIY83_14600 [Flavobacterium sp. SLB02]
MTNCFKKHWFLIIGILLLSNYSIGQTFISFSPLEPSPIKENGRPFRVRINSTSEVAAACTAKIITLEIGDLTYTPGSNFNLPPGIVITEAVNNGKTVLTISGFVNDGKQGESLTMDIAMQFKPGICDDVTQEIVATTTNIGCTVVSEQKGSIEVTARTANPVRVSLSLLTSVSQPVCPRQVLRYQVQVYNDGNKGFNINNAKVNIELDKCATVLGVYKNNTYIPVDNVSISTAGNIQKILFDTPDIVLSPATSNVVYDFFITYPCLDGENDCVSGQKVITAYVTGKKKDCQLQYTETAKSSSYLQTSVNPATCSNVNCATGETGGEGQLEAITISSTGNLPCPSCPQNDPIFLIYFNMPPFHPAYDNRVFVIDIPIGVKVSSASRYQTACGTLYEVNYIDAAGNKQSTPFPGSLTRKVEFKTSCTISAPQTSFWLNLKYDELAIQPAPWNLTFKLNFSSSGKTIFEGNTSRTVDSCNPNLSIYNQVRKATQNYENNFNASAVPGELMIYRQRINNNGTGDTNNSVTIKLDNRLVYEGGFRYIYDNYNNYESDQFKRLEGNPSFYIPELGTVNVSTPVYGEPGTVTMSGFNFPCSKKYLFIEFNVRVKNNVIADAQIPIVTRVYGSRTYGQPQDNIITISSFTYVKSKMFVKCGLANEWNDTGINVKNGEVVDFKMQFSNAGSTPVVLSELINLRPQIGDFFEFGSNPRNSTLNINYNCDLPKAFLNSATALSANFTYANNDVSMDRDMFCPPKSSGNLPNWTSSCDNSNWFRATFLNNLTLLPGDYVDVIFKGRVTGTEGKAFNSFSFRVGGCNILSANSNKLTLENNNTGVGCNSCTLTNPHAAEMKTLFENLMKNILTRKINGESDAQINGSAPAELLVLRPYISSGGGNKIYNFVSTKNAQNKITSVKFSFTADSQNDVSFVEENGLIYNPEVGFIDPSYLKIDTTLYISSEQYLTTCRKTLDNNGGITADCNSKTQVRHIDFCPSRFCSPINSEIKIGD